MMTTPDPDTLTTDQLRSEMHRLLDLSRKANSVLIHGTGAQTAPES